MATKKVKRLILFIPSLILLSLIFVGSMVISLSKTPPLVHSELTHSKTLWQYQCIDTMKTSRDKARQWAGRADVTQLVNREMKAIKDMGATCVALDTPYDDEFLPYLTLWVRAARQEDLAIWFRGNFSSWEGWFEYPRGMSAETLLTKTKNFIISHSSLFEDGDVFTSAPEAENGGPFNQVEIDEYTQYRLFLLQEYKVSKDAFQSIGKDVAVNWMSMNGGLAKRMLDQSTINGLEKTVTLDHYIKTAPEMSEYINYFAKQFGAKTIIGEFGAPIPEINGPMTESQQAAFVGELFHELYKEKDNVIGVNYWVLFDSSTALLNQDFTPRRVTETIKQYFRPTVVRGRVLNSLSKPVGGVVVMTPDQLSFDTTDTNGNYELLIPATSRQAILKYEGKTYRPITRTITLGVGKSVTQNVVLDPQKKSLFYRLWEYFK